MAHKNAFDQAITQAVNRVLEGQLPQLREELVRRVVAEASPHLEGSAQPAGKTDFQQLLNAVSAVHAAATQRDILRTLLDNAVHYAGRVALFVVKTGAATGWQARAFADNDTVKDFALDASCGLVAHVLNNHVAQSGGTKEMDQKFISQFGKPVDDHCLLIPLSLRDKVAALLYADSGLEAAKAVEDSALTLLVLTTGTWLEVISQRKASPKDASSEAGAERTEGAIARAAAAHTAPAFNDPFATHAPAYAKAAAVGSATSGATPSGAVSHGDGPSDLAHAFAGLSPEDAEVHRKAQRFARLLIDEIKLYNQAKLTEGRKNKDLYDRLREDIDKSRSTYQKRYGSTAAASADYFIQEIIRSLAEDDVSLLGPNFKR
jgi:hypothetical protein